MASRADHIRRQLQRQARVALAVPSDPEARARIVRSARKRAREARNRVAALGPAQYPLPKLKLPEGPIARPDLVVATILDPFSELAFTYEWSQVPVQREGWEEQLTAAKPRLLFVESAWRGNNGTWQNAMKAGEQHPDLVGLLAWCRANNVPSVFWNKEDPPNYARFIETAKLFDQVFTVDAGVIPDYIRDLGHDRVGLLPFGAQPRIHNPIRHDRNGAKRPYEVAFAGTYFAEKHPERRAQMEYVLDPARSMGLHIYSRMQRDDSRYQFPMKYRANIVGSLPYEQMLAAYTAYKVFLNVNSVVDSPSMCPRRLFELSAAQTAVVSSPAASIREFFGEDITVVHEAKETTVRLGNLLKHDDMRDRQALRAHRRVMDSHTYGDRVDTVLTAVGLPARDRDQSISVIVPTMRPDQLGNVWRFMAAQVQPNLELVLVPHGFVPDDELLARLKGEHGLERVTVVPGQKHQTLGTLMNLGVEAASGHYVAKLDDDNYYAPHFLSDLVRAFDYTDAQVVGKWAHYVHIGDETGPTLLRFEDSEHRYVRLVQGGTILTPREVALATRFEDLPRRVDTTFLEKIHAAGGRVYSTDRWNFVSVRGADPGAHTWKVSHEDLLARSSRLVFNGDAVAHVTV